ncbi:PREDICTED: squamosa promoter-binding-like protein 14 [Brassica oleracea var. oleracea]|uniref:SBP-type domain-containing protein n=1 Tax=Brassica oleracea var. oleracea TaxID=109376 RepID=A0A0D3CBY4_BRAOL|nr:PREDICTED: squamosa promoter-binding-like protein 14 [Brassica oleracea var. oleracea]XP_013585828.1 PREDICTED: squamosa promoter-binding-like protein 14 [Brassica oleracea var. oleracea]
MEEVGAQVAAPLFIHQSLSPMGRKRNLYHHQMPNRLVPPSQPEQRRDEWNSNLWDWDSRRFEAKPVDAEPLRLGSQSQSQTQFDLTSRKVGEERGLDLNLGSCLNAAEAARPSKKGRSGSPGTGGNYPVCQVDNCCQDLSHGKDYHRRHKVCEVHSKATKALVGKQMQRFCQQCSRFHLLSEFDEGKRSCRRRLAGHNRRRRKTTQPEEVASGVVAPGNRDSTSNANMDLMALLTALACAQGKNEVRPMGSPAVPQREQLLQILNKINALPLPMDLVSKLNSIGSLARKNTDHLVANPQNDVNGDSPSTMDLLAVLSETLGSSSPDTLAILSQGGFGTKENDKAKLSSYDHVATTNVEKRTVGGERSSSSNQSPSQDSDSHAQDTRSSLSLQLFTSSPEDESRRPAVASSRKYYSSASSNPVEDRSPSSSPVMQELFPLQRSPETMRSKNHNNTSPVRTGGCLPLDLFGTSNRGAANPNFKGFGQQCGYASSGSDYSPPSLNSDAQDRTGKIVFKLLDKDPSQLPGTLRTEIYNWLSSIPSEMESYIRPGCVVLSVYVAMSPAAWEQLEQNLQQRVAVMLQDSHSGFWRDSRFIVNTGRQLASHKNGRIRCSKSWRTWNSPELISVSPVAVVAGEETSLVVRGRSLTNDGISIRCTQMGSYVSMEASGAACKRAIFDELNVKCFRVNNTQPGFLGRCFIEVENGFRGDSFPLIIANASICKELNRLEEEFHPKSQEQAHHRPTSREETLCFLNELGWLFQKNQTTEPLEQSEFSLSRFKFLLVCSVERDYCAVIRTLLDMLVERNVVNDEPNREALDMLAEIQLLNRAVKRKSTKMVELLIHYSVNLGSSKKLVFLPNITGPGGITPLHLAACTSDSDDMVDLLTNDPQEIGLSSWNSLCDGTGQTPYSYAAMRNNHTYNSLVARKLADKRNKQVSLNIESEIVVDQLGLSRRSSTEMNKSSCASCATVALKYRRRASGSHRLFPTPIIHSMLAVATVCVCVCVFMHAFPIVRQGSHFSWGGLDYGSI